MEATELLIQRIQSLENEVRDMKNNHLHDLEIRLERIDTTLKIGWKIVLFGAGLPAFISSVLSVIQFIS